jgi:type I restriction enzyme S subunit
MVLIRPKQSLVYHSFLRWWLNSPVIANHIRGFYDGSVAERLNLPVIRTLPVAMPPLAEQKSIAAVLGCLDDKIELLREQNETLETLAQTFFKRWFIDFNFPDENGNLYKDSGGEMVASELGEIPKGWKADILNDYISISGGGTPSTKEPSYWNGEVAWSSPKDLSDRPDAFLFETNKTITASGLGSISSGLNQTGSLLLSSRAPIGYVAFADIPIAVNQGYIVFAPDQYLSNQFMFLWLKKYMSVVNNAANGSTFLEISKKAFKEIVTIIPNERVLHDFQNLILPQFEKLRSNLIQIRTLTLLRETLLPKLMKGELRIRT